MKKLLIIACLGCVIPLMAEGRLVIRSSVSGADVYVDGAWQQHTTPATYTLSAGAHTIMINKEGYRPLVDTIAIEDDQKCMWEVWMEPMDEDIAKRVTPYRRLVWNYTVENNPFRVMWFGIGFGLGSGAAMQLSLADIRYGIVELRPCVWGVNYPFFSGISHENYDVWHVICPDRSVTQDKYDMAIPTQGRQFYYTPMLRVHLPYNQRTAVVLSAGPQISWTHVYWQQDYRELPASHSYIYTTDGVPKSGYHFDHPWFTCEIAVVRTGTTSDMSAFFRYQDGFFIGCEWRISPKR